MTFSIFLALRPSAAGSCRSSGICRASPAPTPTSPRRRVCARACGELGLVLLRAGHEPARRQSARMARGYGKLGKGAGFYVDATQEPWAKHLADVELRDRGACGALAPRFPGRHDIGRPSRPFDGRPRRAHDRAEQFRGNHESRRFAPISRRPTCRRARRHSRGYLGAGPKEWRKHDAVALIEDGARVKELLVDVGTAPVPEPGASSRAPRARLLQAGDRADSATAAWLRPQLLLHLDLHGRAFALARGEIGVADAIRGCMGLVALSDGAALLVSVPAGAESAASAIIVRSPDGRNAISLALDVKGGRAIPRSRQPAASSRRRRGWCSRRARLGADHASPESNGAASTTAGGRSPARLRA